MSRSIRSLHTSLRRCNVSGSSSSSATASTNPKTRDILASFTESLPSPTSASSSASAPVASGSGSAPQDIARRMLSERMAAAPREEPGRKAWSVGQRISPHHLLRPSLYPTQPPPVRPPLLGPPARLARKIDPFVLSHTKPLDYVWNPEFGRAFVNQMGRIQSRAETGLSWKSQRGVGKLVRRQRAMGILPKFSGSKGPGGYGHDEYVRRY